MDSDKLEKLIQTFSDSPLTLLEVNDGETRLKMRKPGAGEQPAASMQTPVGTPLVTGAPLVAGMPLIAGTPMAGAAQAVAGTPAVAGMPAAAGAPAAAAAQPAPQTPSAPADDLVDITSPLVGVFYSAASPDEPPYVSEGDHVEPGDVLCLIEAMKMFNEVKAERAGTVRRVVAQNGSAVGVNDVLMQIEAD